MNEEKKWESPRPTTAPLDALKKLDAIINNSARKGPGMLWPVGTMREIIAEGLKSAPGGEPAPAAMLPPDILEIDDAISQGHQTWTKSKRPSFLPSEVKFALKAAGYTITRSAPQEESRGSER